MGTPGETTGTERRDDAPTPRRLLPVWVGTLVAGSLAVALLLAHPEIRAWLRLNLFLPTVARVLGRDTILADGQAIAAGPAPFVTLALAGVYTITLLLIRALLLYHGGQAGERIGRRIRLDASLVLATLPFIALAALIESLAEARLFQAPWAFFAVPPLLVHLAVALLLFSLILALWTESGGAQHHRGRFVASALLALVTQIAWLGAFAGTTRALPLWGPVVAFVVALLVYHSVTLGGRIVSHRRALFSLGCLHIAFFAGFTALWFIEGPWPLMDWRFADQGAVLTVYEGGWRLLILTIGPPLIIAVGAYTLGAFLHTYSRLAHVWVAGLNVVALFAQTLHAWVVTLAATDPYGAFGRTGEPFGALAAWTLPLLGGWGYLYAKILLSLIVITLLSRHPALRHGRNTEIRSILLAVIAALGLAPGLRLALTLSMGL